jgi:hypothetical protein
MQNDGPVAEDAAASVSEVTHPGNRRSQRQVELKFWFGPVKLWSVAFDMEVQQWRPDPFCQAAYAAPVPNSLPDDLDGIYRPSEIIGANDPDCGFIGPSLRYVESRFNRRFIDLTTGFDAYMAKFSSKTRSTLRRKLRKFEEASSGRLDWTAHRSAPEMQVFHEEARRVSRRTYQEKLFDSGLPEDGTFLRTMLERADAGQVRGFILFLAGVPVSYLYLPIADGRVIYGHLGFDPAYAALSPGTVLQLLALESLFAEGVHRVFDFTEGEGEHKRLFATHERLCGNVFYLRPTLRNRAVVRLHLVTRRLSSAAERQLARRDLKVRLKHYLRGQRRVAQDQVTRAEAGRSDGLNAAGGMRDVAEDR